MKENKKADEQKEQSVDMNVDEDGVNINECTEKLESLQQVADQWKNDYYKVFADMENTKKRMQNEQDTFIKYATQSMTTDLLPVVDNFERAMEVKSDDPAVQKFVKGFEMIHEQLIKVLNQHGVEVIEAINQPFDPNYHQAVASIESDLPSNTIVEELQKGYKLKDRVIRPSLVKVSE